jgi:hypothetical protein
MQKISHLLKKIRHVYFTSPRQQRKGKFLCHPKKKTKYDEEGPTMSEEAAHDTIDGPITSNLQPTEKDRLPRTRTRIIYTTTRRDQDSRCGILGHS